MFIEISESVIRLSSYIGCKTDILKSFSNYDSVVLMNMD